MKDKDKIIRIKVLLNELSNKDRMEVFDDYCKYCGNNEGGGLRCYCWQDD